MRIVRGNLIVLFVFLVLAVEVIVAGCASNRPAEQTDEIKEIVVRGELTGKVTIAFPNSTPEDPENPIFPLPASGVELLISTLSGQKIGSVVTESNGEYNVQLPPGIYHIAMTPLPPIPANRYDIQELPANVIITEWQETRLDVHILVLPGPL